MESAERFRYGFLPTTETAFCSSLNDSIRPLGFEDENEDKFLFN